MNFAVPFLFGLAAVLMGRRDEQAPRRTTSGARQGADTATTTATTTAANTVQTAAGRIPTADEIAVALASLRQGGAAAPPPHTPTPAAPPAAPNLDAVLAALRQQAGAAAPPPHTPTPAAPPAAPNLDAVLAALRQQAGGAAAPPQPGQPGGAAANMTPIGPSSLGPQVLASRQLAAYYAQGGRDRTTIAALQRQMGGIPADGVVGPQTIARTAELNRGAAAPPPLGGGAPTTRI